jgi:hypothetical protein
MARDTKDGRIVFAYVEGDQATLQQALQQMGSVVSRGMAPQTKTIIAVPVNGKALPLGTEKNETQLYEVAGEEISETEKIDGPSNISPSQKSKSAKRAPKVPDLLPDEDLISDEISFRDFASRKNPSTQFDKYLVIAAWFKRYKKIEEITTRHIFSCYQLMHWSAPDDLLAPFRDMKRLHNYFSKGRAPRSWILTLVGSNEVDDMNRSAASE